MTLTENYETPSLFRSKSICLFEKAGVASSIMENADSHERTDIDDLNPEGAVANFRSLGTDE